MSDRVRARSLDHVALWVSERELIADLLCRHLGMHVITSGEDFTLVGIDAKEGKLTLFDADPPRERGVLERVVLRVGDLNAAIRHLPPGLWTQANGDSIELTFPDGLHVGLKQAPGADYDLDHVVLRVPDPGSVASWLGDLGFERRDGRLEVAGRQVSLATGNPAQTDRPLLNHVALLVDSVAEVRAAAEARGLEIDREVDAENTLAVFVRGPAGILVEYVEHKPGFSLA
ncbi:MAG TPA: VOC family protein [Candidatus Acidoferrum sp.]|nr:VOC family protein [Candidatus Acidoferrum sp.]